MIRRLLPASVLFGLLLAVPAAEAAACPGAADPCPYSSSQVVGQRVGGAFRFPQGIASAADGTVYVADQFGRNVQSFAPDGTFKGDFGTQGTGDGQFTAGIGGLAIDPTSGDVFAIDSRVNRIERFTKDGVFKAVFGGPGTAAGQFSFGGGTDSDDTAGGGIVVGGGKLYVADTLNNRVQRMNLDGTNPQVLSYPTGTGPFSIPEGIGWNTSTSTLYVADNRNDRVVAAQPDPTAATVANVSITAPNTAQPDGTTLPLDQPYDVALDQGNGLAFVASDQNSRLVRLGAPAGAGFASEDVFGSFGAAANQIEYPRSIAVGGGEVFLAEAGNNRVQVFDETGASKRTFGFPARDGGNFTLPNAVSADRYGDVLAADTFAYRGVDVQADGGVRDVIGEAKLYDNTKSGDAQPGRFLGLNGLAQAPDGTIFALDVRAKRVVHFNADGTLIGVLARDVVSVGSGGGVAGGIAVAADGGVWISDEFDDVLKRLDPTSGAVTATIGGNGTAPGQFDSPQGLAIDALGNLWVADAGNKRVQELTPGGTPLLSLGATGPALNKPVAVALDGRGHAYVADVGNSDVAVYSSVTGLYSTGWGERGVGAGQLLHPRGITVDCNGTVVVADTDANRLQRFVPTDPGPSTCVARPVPPPPPPAPAPAPPAPVVVKKAVATPKPKPHAAKLSVRLVRTTGALGKKGLAVKLSCNVACSISPSFKLSVAAGKTAFAVRGGGTRKLKAGQSITIALHPSKATIRSLRKRLGKHRGLRLALRVKAARTGASTSTTTKGYSVRV